MRMIQTAHEGMAYVQLLVCQSYIAQFCCSRSQNLHGHGLEDLVPSPLVGRPSPPSQLFCLTSTANRQSDESAHQHSHGRKNPMGDTFHSHLDAREHWHLAHGTPDV